MNTEVKNQGIGFGSLLTLMLVAFKILGYIDWSWWWVVSPFIGGFVLKVIARVALNMLDDRDNTW